MFNEKRKLISEFCRLNKPYWDSPTSFNSKSSIFVFSAYNLPAAIVTDMLLAKKIQESNSQKIIVGYTNINNGKKRIFKSFGISKIIFILRPNIYNIINSLKHLPLFLSCKNGDDILKLTIDNNQIPVGEEVYDFLLRTCKEFTINHLHIRTRIKACIYVYYFYAFYALVKKERVNTFVYHDCDYINSAFLKVCQKIKIEIFQTIPLISCVIQHKESFNYKTMTCIQVRHSDFKDFISNNDCDSLMQKEFKEHFQVNNHTLFDGNGFKDKKIYTKSALLQSYGLKDDKKIVLVAAHAFSDLPHVGYDMFFRDYYDWFENTIKILSGIDKYHIFVKEHPSSKEYGEQGSIKYILNKINITNVYTIPDDLSTYCLYDFVDCFVTCNGTIGLEAACFGIPVITACKGYYYGFELDYNCSDYKSYQSCLERIDSLVRRPDICNRAKIVLSIVSNRVRLYPTTFMPNVYRLEGKSLLDDYKVMNILNKSLADNSPKDEWYNSQLKNVIIFDDNCCPSKLKNNFKL